MRTNGIISDPEPLTTPAEPTAVSQPKSDWEKLGKSAQYPEVDKYIQNKITFYQRYLPGGLPIENLSEEHRAIAWGQATTVISVLEELKSLIDMQSGRNDNA